MKKWVSTDLGYIVLLTPVCLWISEIPHFTTSSAYYALLWHFYELTAVCPKEFMFQLKVNFLCFILWANNKVYISYKLRLEKKDPKNDIKYSFLFLLFRNLKNLIYHTRQNLKLKHKRKTNIETRWLMEVNVPCIVNRVSETHYTYIHTYSCYRWWKLNLTQKLAF